MTPKSFPDREGVAEGHRRIGFTGSFFFVYILFSMYALVPVAGNFFEGLQGPYVNVLEQPN
jgi:hypothetical protein